MNTETLAFINFFAMAVGVLGVYWSVEARRIGLLALNLAFLFANLGLLLHNLRVF